MPNKNGTRRYQRIPTEERRIQLIDSATRLIGEYGFRGIALRDVAEDCDITQGGILYHFKTKDELLIAVLDHRDKVDRELLCESLGIDKLGGDPFPVGIKDLTMATCRMNVENPQIIKLYAVLQGESLSEDHPAWQYFQDREQWVLEEYTQAAKREGLQDPERAAMVVLAAMDGLQLRWLRSGMTIDFVKEWERIIDRIVRNL